MRILAIGDVHGSFDAMVALIGKHKPDLCLQVGDIEAVRDAEDLRRISGPEKYIRVKDFPAYWTGQKKIPVETICIGGNHEAWNLLADHDPAQHKDPYLIPNLRYLGRWGVLEVGGVTIAGLSGNYSSADYEESSDVRRKLGEKSGWLAAPKKNSHFRKDEVEGLIRRCEGKSVDVLITHEWPAGLVSPEQAAELAKTSPGRISADRILAYGQQPIRDLVDAIRPKFHFCGHVHRRHEGTIGRTKVICLGIITSGDDAAYLLDTEKM